MPNVITPIKKISEVFTTQVKELSEGVLEFVGSVESTKDRDGEVIKASGWELENYKKNPIVLWAHDYSAPPVGKATSVKVSKGQLVFTVKFADAETYPFADTIYKLCKGGFLNATSVGFIPKEWETGKKENDPSRTYLKQELLELSIVPVPSNPDALRNAFDKGLITIKEFESLVKTVDFNQELNVSILKDAFWQMLDTFAGCVSKTACDKGDADRYGTMSAHGEAFTTSYNKWVKDCKKSGLFEMQDSDMLPIMMSFRNFTAKEQPKAEKKTSQLELRDEIDYCLSIINKVGLSDDNKPKAIELMNEIKRITGGDMPDEIITVIPEVKQEEFNPKEFLNIEINRLMEV
jgi:HK97 family phage prohead protease